MLPAQHRLRASRDFTAVMRRGRRGSSPSLVVHILPAGEPGPARIGFVVSRAVGNAVVRHRVTRRLRALIRPRLDDLPAGTSLVVRALPAAATRQRDAMDADLATALHAAGIP